MTTIPTATPAETAALRDLAAHSVQVIRDAQHASGAYPACPTYRVYGFSWFRDNTFIAEGMSRQGATDSATGFHDWAANVVAQRADRIDEIATRLARSEQLHPADFLPTRYTLDGQEETGQDWWNFQTDGYGTWLWGLATHLRRHQLDPAPYAPAVTATVRYLAATWDLPCYDWWEEHVNQRHVATMVCLEAGLRAALSLGILAEADARAAADTADLIRHTVRTRGTVQGRLTKWIGSTRVDGSLLAAVAPLRTVDDATAHATVAAIEKDLTFDHGVHRYLGDTFYGGGRWPVLAALLGQAYLRLDRPQDAFAQLRWIASTATADGLLPEQVSDVLLDADRKAEWIDRWGPVATPLLWSHGMYLTLAHSLGIHL
jgi:GH15 family glucan-1,4-alpha-glucosidase